MSSIWFILIAALLVNVFLNTLTIHSFGEFVDYVIGTIIGVIWIVIVAVWPIYFLGFFEGREWVVIIAIVAYIIFVPLSLIHSGRLINYLGAPVKSLYLRLTGKPQDSEEAGQTQKIEQDDPARKNSFPKRVLIKLMEYCVGAIMLLAYAGLTICFFSFLWPPPFIQTLMQTLDGIWGIVVRIVWIAGTLAYILFAILFLLHFGKLHGRVCAAVKSGASKWLKK